jgi:TonB-linked SusC/RagA family outer membrane protein
MRKLALFFAGAILCSLQLLAQNTTLTGTVVDSRTGAPLSDVTVTATGTSIGTKTDADGKYSITFPSTARTLSFSYVGYQTITRAIGRLATMDVELAELSSDLSEVVVVGYGTQQKKAFTGAASKIDAKEFSQLVTPSVDRQLGGRAAGVQVSTPGGLVNTPARIRVRGVNSITGNRSPLIVVDGVPFINGNLAGTTNSNALGDINPNDIENIEVLKDGSATAIFGSRGANGVIMITTKKGAKEKLKVNYDMSMGVTNVRRAFDLLNAEQFITIANEKSTNSGNPNAPRAVANPGVDTDWQNEVFVQNAFNQQHNISFQGGTRKSLFYFSFGYSDQQGVIISNKNTAYRIRFNFESELNRFIKFGNNTTLAKQIDFDQNNGSNSLGGAVASPLRLLPNISPFNPNHPSGFNILDGNNGMQPLPNSAGVEDNFFNVAFTLRNNIQKSDKHRIVNNSFVEISPFKGFKFRSSFTYDILADYSFLSWDPRHGDGFGSQGIAQNIQNNYQRSVFQNYINYNFSVDKHNFYVTAGHEYQADEIKAFSATGSQVADRFFLQENLITGAAQVQQVGGGFTQRRLESLFGRFNYDFGAKYFAQFTFRRDGLSSFAPDARYDNFMGGSVGYRISEESFWKNSAGLSRVVNDFKIKASMAETGNDIDGFPYLSQFAARPYGNISGLGPSVVGNSALTWERSLQTNFGFEAGLFNSRFLFNFDYFINDISRLIFQVPTPPSAGVPNNQIAQNVGKMRNTGMEFTLSGDIVRKRDFTWGFTANFTSLKNEVRELYTVSGTTATQINNGQYNLIKVGEQVNVINGLVWAGVNTQTGNPMYVNASGGLVQHNTSAVPGVQANGFFLARSMDDATMTTATSLTFNDRRLLGNPLPTWFGGFGNNFRYKNFDAEFFFRFSGGNDIVNITRQEILLNQSFQNNGTEILQRWTTPGQVTNVPRLRHGQGNNINQNGLAVSRFVESGDFIRLQNIVIGYNFNSAKLATKTNGFISGLRIFVQGQNLWIGTKYTGTDPENVNEAGLDAAVSPQVGIVSGGLRVSF